MHAEPVPIFRLLISGCLACRLYMLMSNCQLLSCNVARSFMICSIFCYGAGYCLSNLWLVNQKVFCLRDVTLRGLDKKHYYFGEFSPLSFSFRFVSSLLSYCLLCWLASNCLQGEIFISNVMLNSTQRNVIVSDVLCMSLKYIIFSTQRGISWQRNVAMISSIFKVELFFL